MLNRLVFGTMAMLVFTAAAPAKRIAAPPSPVQRALQAEVVIVGKVTTIEKDVVEVKPEPGAPATVAYQVAIVKIDSALAGAENLTHIKVGFIPQAQNTPRPRGLPTVGLKEGNEGIFFLTRHPTGGFHTFNWMSAPQLGNAKDVNPTVDSVRKALEIVADPMKALKAANAADRAFAATVLLTKYRTVAPGEGTVAQEKVARDESRLLLQGLAAADWTKADASGLMPTQAFYLLGLNKSHQWTPPKPGKPGVNYNAELQKAFAAWVEGPGKDFQVTKLVRKKK